MKVKLGHIELFVKNPSESKKFYMDVLGFKLVEVQGDGNFVWLCSGESVFLLRPGKGAKRGVDYQSSSSGLVIYTDDLPASKEQMESKGLEFKGTDGSENCLTFTDPDGNWFQLVNPEDH
ncbi:MAG: VOC family protein [Ignavibacteriae bacterium]|nr:VOC family protein [Ignavibacteriota bacterium]MCB0723191.1 VOC family protein [Ignavibacteriota bacterium]MCB9243037.1 VOC family protein [Ignavibacteriales bacterium]